MPALVFVLMIIVLGVTTAEKVTHSRYVQDQISEAATLGANMMIVRNALQAFMRLTPGVSGEVPLAALGLPLWFSPDSAIKVLVQDSRGYVYHVRTQTKTSVDSALGPQVPGLAGIAINGRLVTPGMLTTINLPASIPDYSLVLML